MLGHLVNDHRGGLCPFLRFDEVGAFGLLGVRHDRLAWLPLGRYLPAAGVEGFEVEAVPGS